MIPSVGLGARGQGALVELSALAGKAGRRHARRSAIPSVKRIAAASLRNESSSGASARRGGDGQSRSASNLIRRE